MLIKKKSVAVLCCIVFTALLLPYGRPSSGDAEITEQGEVKPVAPSSQVFNRLSAVYNNMTYWDDRNMQGPVYQIPAVAPPGSPHATGVQRVAIKPYGTLPWTPMASPQPRSARNPAYTSTLGM